MLSSATSLRARLMPLLVGAALVASLTLVAPVAATEPLPGQPVALGEAAAKPFGMNVYRKGDFVSQTNLVQCVGTSMQMMINMIRAKDDRSAGWQLELQNLARRYSARNWDGTEANGQVRQRRGASVRGWAFGLNKLGFGPYRVTSGATIEEAVQMAAVAIRRTGRPVGLLVWRGRHAWVMSGFEATGDPLTDDTARVTHVYVQDPLYPRISSVWGRSPAPNTKLSIRQLGEDFLARRSRSGNTGGRWTIVMPFAELRAVDRRFHVFD
jgi:hypothetical protein